MKVGEVGVGEFSHLVILVCWLKMIAVLEYCLECY